MKRFTIPTLVAALAVVSLSAYAEPNAEMKEVLDAYAVLSPVPIEKTTPAIAKAAPTISAAVKAVMKKDQKTPPAFTGKTEDFKINVGNGQEVDARAYIPAGEGPFPTVLYIHGGGWVIADIDVYDSTPRALCETGKFTVISVDYLKAPKYHFPTAHDNTLTAYQWVLENAGKYKGDPKKVAVAGESAGGNMAASICFEARDKGLQAPVHQLLVYPVANNDMTTKSYQENEHSKPLSAEGMKWFAKHTFAQPEDSNNPRFALLKQKDFSKLPPATIILAEIDPLRTEGMQLGDKLKEAGVPVKVELYKGVTHEFFGMGAVVKEAFEAETLAVNELKASFGKK